MNLTYKRATLEDIDILTETRIEVLRAANKLSADLFQLREERILGEGIVHVPPAHGEHAQVDWFIHNGQAFGVKARGRFRQRGRAQ